MSYNRSARSDPDQEIRTLDLHMRVYELTRRHWVAPKQLTEIT